MSSWGAWRSGGVRRAVVRGASTGALLAAGAALGAWGPPPEPHGGAHAISERHPIIAYHPLRAPLPTHDAAARIPRLTIARLQYDGGGDWYANPSSLPNLLEAIGARTSLRVERREARVRLTDDALWDYPFLHATGHGEIKLSDAEVARLREYLLRGGFLHVSDNYGFDASVRRELARVFPDRPLVDVPLAHPVYHVVYPFPAGLPKIHEHDGKPARGLGVFIGDRLAVFYDHQSDLGNGWEDPQVHNDPPALREAALRMGVNLFVYAVTSRPLP